MASASWVSRIRQAPSGAGDEAAFVLLHAMAEGDDVSSPDLRLVATEGTSPFVGRVKHDHLRRLRTKNYQGSDAEWEAIVLSVVLGRKGRLPDSAVLDGLDVVANVDDGSEMTITIRADIGGIILRLGTITLHLNESQEIQLFDWAGQAVQAATAACEEAVSSKRRQWGQSQMIANLQGQLDDLVQAKDEHETLLLEKFQALLDSKKAKIRDQQRHLDEANGPAATAAVTTSLADSGAKDDDRSRRRTTRKPDSSSPRKRKVAAHVDLPDVDRSAPDEANADSAEDDDRSLTQTISEPSSDDDEAAEESDPAEKVPPPSPPSQTKGNILEPPSRRNPPPPRRLPFGDHVHQPSDLPPSERSLRVRPITARTTTKTTASAAEVAPVQDDDVDHPIDESGDDEL